MKYRDSEAIERFIGFGDNRNESQSLADYLNNLIGSEKTEYIEVDVDSEDVEEEGVEWYMEEDHEFDDLFWLTVL